MGTLPLLNTKTKENKSPHIVILGAGASLACFPNGDRYNRKLPLMNNFNEIVGLGELLEDKGIDIHKINFEDFYDNLVSSRKDIELQEEIENKTFGYFSKMVIRGEPTIYDYLILSLREKDLIASFNWDPMLIQAYRRNIDLKKLPRICFLHGNVGIGACIKDKCCGYIDQQCSVCGKPFQRVRLLYPIKNKDYTSDPFIKNEWSILKDFLEKAYIVTIFGYSAPETDVAAREIMMDVWRKNTTRELAEIEIIDLKSKRELLKTWGDFIIRQHYGIIDNFRKSYLWRYPRRSCDAFAGATLQQEPWHENPFPEPHNLNELQTWVKSLIDEEREVENKKVSFKIK